MVKIILNLSDYNKGLIYTEVNGCIDCNKCIHGCPILKSNVSVTDRRGKYRKCVDDRECTLCGTCIDTCIHGVRHYKDDVDEFLTELKQGREFSVLVAPSLYLNYPTEYKKLMGYLKSLGVKKFYSAGIGADIATLGYINYLTKNKENTYISQSCPSVVHNIEKHTPELIPNLIPIQSPMMCTAIYLKKYKGITGDLAFLSPCIAKKSEISSKRGMGLIRHNVTFNNLMKHVVNMGINLDSYPDAEDEKSHGMGTLYPQPGGLRENIEFYMSSEVEVLQIDGANKSSQYFKTLAERIKNNDSSMPNLVDVLSCEMGCSYGTGTAFRMGDNYKTAHNALVARKNKLSEINHHSEDAAKRFESRYADIKEEFKGLNLEDFMCEYEKDSTVSAHTATESQIDAIFTDELQKLSYDDRHVNCSACGYNTCRDMAEAIAMGINHYDNCIYYVKKAFAEAQLATRDKLEGMLSEMKTVAHNAEELNKTIYDNSPLFMETWDLEGNLIDCNKKCIELFGIESIDEFKNNPYRFSSERQPCGKLSPEKNKELIELALMAGVSRSGWEYRLSNGEILPTESTWVHVKHFGKSLIIVYALDVRPVKQALDRAHEFEKMLLVQGLNERIKLMFDSAPLLIEYWSRDYKIIDCNQNAFEFYGFSSKEEYSKENLKTLPETQSDKSLSLDARIKHLDEVFDNGYGRYEFTKKKLNGEEVILEVDAVRIQDKEDYVVVTYAKDVTELHKLQKEQQLKEIAEQGNQAKSNFLAKMSHEIRTPITSVMGISEIQLQDADLSPQTEEAFAKIYSSANSLLAIVNDILDLSRIEAGKMELVGEEYMISDLITDVSQIHLTYLRGKNIKFNLSVDEALPTQLIGDSLRIAQIVKNLLSNAFKYTSEGSVDLIFTCERNESKPHEKNLVISIRDSGFGMTAEQVSNLNKEYTRYHESEYRYIEGTGLGMPIVFNLVKMMNATISISSEVGEGTTVSICIPQKITSHDILGDKAAERLMNLEETKSIGERPVFKPESMPYGTVLIVDDVEANLYVARGLMEFYDLTIDTCTSGFDAIDRARCGIEYDVVFMDYMMPKINGTEAMKQMRELGYTKPIVALTANAMIGQAEEFIKEGFDSYISKPIQTKHLDAVLVKYIRDKQSPEVVEAAREASKNKASKIDINSFQTDPELLATLRAEFARTNKDLFSRLIDEIEAGDFMTAHRMMHTLKSSAGMLYEKRLIELAKRAEQSLSKNEKPPKSLLSDLELELSRVLLEIGEINLADYGENDVSENSDDMWALFDKLAPLLEAQNVACMNLLADLYKFPQASELCGQIEDYDFDSALETLNKLREL